ncbi:MAG: 16S rRNA (cytosine(1402)-N(4))-methyltransferase RsmH [Phycisphaeraceae bacterium]
MPDDPHGHIPVLLEPTLEVLAARPGETVVDATAGRGGHAAALLERIGPGGRLLLVDRDAGNLEYARGRIKGRAEGLGVEVRSCHGSFSRLREAVAGVGLDRVDVLLADLGFASNQMDDAERGLAFSNDGPLDMRLDRSSGSTAEELLATASEQEIADILFHEGEERLSRRIARKIVETRRERPIKSTAALAELVRSVYGSAAGRSRMHPATRTFMALRIAVNQELPALDALLSQVPDVMRDGGRAAIISFHSLEDRRVKQAFSGWAKEDRAKLLTRKPVEASLAEATSNPRSRSAKLRGLTWLGGATRM